MTPPLALVHLPRSASQSVHAAFTQCGIEVRLVRTPDEVINAAHDGALVRAILRHPVDRLESYFNLRLRSGRPLQPKTWSDREASSFAVIRSFAALCDALVGDDVWLQSVAERMLVTLSKGHGNLLDLHRQCPASVLRVAGTFDALPAAVESIAADLGCAAPTLSDDPAVIDATPPSLRSTPSEAGRAAIRQVMRAEIFVYQDLLVTN